MKTMKWYDWMQYGILLLVAFAVPNSWRFGLWIAMLLVPVTIVKMIAQRRVGNPALKRPLRVALYGPIVYWLLLAISLLWSGDTATGLELLQLKAVLLIFPLCFLISDTSYLTMRHLRGIGYALLVGVVGAFLHFMVRAIIAMLHGTAFQVFQNTFYCHACPGVYHHAYIALYTVVAMAFIYNELSRCWKELKGWLRGALIVALLMIVCHTVIVNSRAGMLAMGLTAVACVAHLVITRRNWKLGLLVGFLVVAAFVATTQLMPGYVNRLSATVENVQDDARTHINRSNWHAFLERPLFGYGAGDYHASQVEQYGSDGFDYGANASFNAHNQYMESLLSTGIPGLLVLLFFLLAPLWTARRSHSLFLMALLTAIVMFNLLFESMLERQMGLLFIGSLFPLMVLIMSVEENKFGQVRGK